MVGAVRESGSTRPISGFSLLETLISFFIVVAALLTMAQLFHTSLSHGTRVEERQIGSLLAQEKLEEIRAWAADPDNYEGSWGIYDNKTFVVPAYPAFTVRTTLVDEVLASPSSLLEDNHPLAERRLMASACKDVTVECWWGTQATERTTLVSRVARPARTFRNVNPIVITGAAPVPLPQDDTASFTVQGFDVNDNEIENLTFSWSVLPDSGNGSVVNESRDGRSASIGNWLYAIDGVTRTYAPGKCELRVEARYEGRVEIESVPIEMQ